MAEAMSSEVRFREVQRERWTGFRIAMIVLSAYWWLGFLRHLPRIAEDGSYGDLVFSVPVLLAIGVALPLSVLFGRFETRVEGGMLHLRRTALGYAFRRRQIALGSIRSAEHGTCYPHIDHGAWSTHAGGPEGVRLHLEGGEIVQIASKRPAELLAALDGVIRRASPTAPAR